jgi:hypothetical protein
MFLNDALHCPFCHGRKRLIAFITDAPVIPIYLMLQGAQSSWDGLALRIVFKSGLLEPSSTTRIPEVTRPALPIHPCLMGSPMSCNVLYAGSPPRWDRHAYISEYDV